MDDILNAKLMRFRKEMGALKPSTKALFDWVYGLDINIDEVQAPEKLYERFMQDVIALNRRNEGQFKLEEAEGISEIDTAFQSLFQENAEMGGLVSADDAFNMALKKVSSLPSYKEYSQIWDKLINLIADKYEEMATPEDQARAEAFARDMTARLKL